MRTEIPWNERVNMLSINPDAATRDDVAKMAAQLQTKKECIVQIQTVGTHMGYFELSVADRDKAEISEWLLHWAGRIDELVDDLKATPERVG